MSVASRRSTLLLLTVATWMAAGCSGPTEPEPPDPTVLQVVVNDMSNGESIANSNVVLYRADNREAVVRGMTDAAGSILFEQPSGDYYLHVSAQGFDPTPPDNITPIPFFVAAEDTTVKPVSLRTHELAANAGFVFGTLQPAHANFLILAESQATQEEYFTASGPDGVFVIYNLPFGAYSFTALKAGYQMTGVVEASLASGSESDTVQVVVSDYAGSGLSGSVTFLAAENSVVDVTLLDPETRAVVPGLSVMNTSNLSYAIGSIPDGNYIAWASLRNDGYVLDPDWLFKNPGGLDLEFTTAMSTQLSFSVTDAITLLSPTNPAENTLPQLADSAVPTFSWEAYPSTKEYFIEVRDLSGDLLWGGFQADGTANHAFIGANVQSVAYNFDNQTGVPALQPGQIYQWRLWADKGTGFDSFVEQLISASEDLRGLFQIPAEEPAM